MNFLKKFKLFENIDEIKNMNFARYLEGDVYIIQKTSTDNSNSILYKDYLYIFDIDNNINWRYLTKEEKENVFDNKISFLVHDIKKVNNDRNGFINMYFRDLPDFIEEQKKRDERIKLMSLKFKDVDPYGEEEWGDEE